MTGMVTNVIAADVIIDIHHLSSSFDADVIANILQSPPTSSLIFIVAILLP